MKIQKPNPYSVSTLQDNHGIGQRRRKELNDERILVMQTSAYYAHIFADILNSGSQPIMVLTDLHQEAIREKGQKGENDCGEQWQSTFLPSSFLSMYYQQGLTREYRIRVINEVFIFENWHDQILRRWHEMVECTGCLGTSVKNLKLFRK